MKESNMPKVDFLMSMVLIVFGVFVMITSALMPDFTDQNFNRFSAPGIVPSFLGAIFIVLGIVMLVRSIIRKGYRVGLTMSSVSTWIKDKSTLRFLITLGLSILYSLILLGRVHYFIATAIYMFIFIFMFEYQRRVKIMHQKKMILIALLMSLVTSGAVYGVFRYLFLVNLPG